MDKTYRAIDIKISPSVAKEVGFWRVFWGADIFINDVPVLKSLVLANVLVWIALAVL